MPILAQDSILCRTAPLSLVTALIHKPVGGQSHSLRGLYGQVLDAFCYLTLEGRGAAAAVGRAYPMDCELAFVLISSQSLPQGFALTLAPWGSLDFPQVSLLT